MYAAMTPSEATRPDFLSALERPFLRSHSTAWATSPCVSMSAFFASIMPAPVWSRNAFAALASTLNCAAPHPQTMMHPVIHFMGSTQDGCHSRHWETVSLCLWTGRYHAVQVYDRVSCRGGHTGAGDSAAVLSGAASAGAGLLAACSSAASTAGSGAASLPALQHSGHDPSDRQPQQRLNKTQSEPNREKLATSTTVEAQLKL